MTLQKFKITLCIYLVSTLSTYSMEHNNNNLHPLFDLPHEVQRQIIFPCYTDDVNITLDKMDELKEVIEHFFKFNIVCKHFNKNFKLPWSDWDLAKKNKMLEIVIRFMTVLDYKQYRTVPLALVCSGADPDIMPESWHTSLHKAVLEEDKSAVAMLLKHKADPYQFDSKRMPICFGAKKQAIIMLFLEKVDKNELLSKSAVDVGWELIHGSYSPELMKFWLDYGVSPRYIRKDYDECIFHHLIRCFNQVGNTIDKITKKGELLLMLIPDMINTINIDGRTPIDMAVQLSECHGTKTDWYKATIALFRQYGGKTAKELEEEHVQ